MSNVNFLRGYDDVGDGDDDYDYDYDYDFVFG